MILKICWSELTLPDSKYVEEIIMLAPPDFIVSMIH